MTFTRARAVADAVLFEGYLLYPYRASAPKNRLRWQFGVLAPPIWSQARGSDPAQLELTCLIEAAAGATVTGQLRFLQIRSRRIEQAMVDDQGRDEGFCPVPSLEVGQRLHLTWDEGEVRQIELRAEVAAATLQPVEIGFDFPASSDTESLRSPEDPAGAVKGRIVRETLALAGAVHLQIEPLDPAPLHRLHIRVENRSGFALPTALRDEALRASLLGTHLLLAMEGGRFLSLTDPPAWAAPAAKHIRNAGLYPVLVEEAPGQDVVLAAPFILHDHPRIAPESTGDFYDAAEIDELLTLRALTLTDAEKREARATDPRAEAILDRVESAGPAEVERLHGTFRDLPKPAHLRPGARVRLRPGPRRTDAQDMFLAGRIATIEAIMQDVEGRDCLAVTVDDDPATELYRSQGRFLYFYCDEVETT